MWNASENGKPSVLHTYPTRPDRPTRRCCTGCLLRLAVATGRVCRTAVAGRLCGSSSQSSPAPSRLSQLPAASAPECALCADTTAARAWARQDTAAAAARHRLKRLARRAQQCFRQDGGLCNHAALTRARAYVKLQVRGVGDCRTSNVPIEAPSEARSGVSARLPTAHAALIETCLRGLLPEQATTAGGHAVTAPCLAWLSRLHLADVQAVGRPHF